MSSHVLSTAFAALQKEAIQLAGGLTELTQRATVYHHVFQHSGGNHAFPLIAAHGALWAKGYFPRCLRLGRVLSWQYVGQPARRCEQLEHLERFANAVRDINRRVCVDTYTNYHFTARFGHHPDANQFVPARLLEALKLVHSARLAGRELASEDKRAVFEAHFLHEQEHVVGPSIDAAMADFDWPLVKFCALRPIIRFAYFPLHRYLFFRDFSQRTERIANGLRAFEFADQAGWAAVAASLRQYQALPEPFFNNSARYFETLRQAVLA